MYKNLGIFALAFAVAFGGGYLVFKQDTPKEAAQQVKTDNAKQTQQTDSKEQGGGTKTQPQQTTSADEGKILSQLGCTGCHAVSSLNIKGGVTGPDLSQAYVNVKGKHGVSLEEFLKKPTSAVMSGVIGGKPLKDEERNAVIQALKAASEKK
ncbi:cytochrome C [Effusibacillus lacus]|uniref:Cytochrome C n=1 Tax=Effusibacillus lacus TaxID=1348429 RepID=A0A292YR52_9BACL|nr:cytochrome C [Effusibacillus lacus]TCS76095.1 hypothetical protein EDD64_10467 [Effusibacillus lacus]GAX91391.1 cytochrome C [Effusibacillus lacus]